MHKVLSKFSEGDFQDAVHLVCSEETIVNYLDETFAALQQKHPAPHQGLVIEQLAAEFEFKGELSELDVACAVKSFPCWSSVGLMACGHNILSI